MVGLFFYSNNSHIWIYIYSSYSSSIGRLLVVGMDNGTCQYHDAESGNKLYVKNSNEAKETVASMEWFENQEVIEQVSIYCD